MMSLLDKHKLIGFKQVRVGRKLCSWGDTEVPKLGKLAQRTRIRISDFRLIPPSLPVRAEEFPGSVFHYRTPPSCHPRRPKFKPHPHSPHMYCTSTSTTTTCLPTNLYHLTYCAIISQYSQRWADRSFPPLPSPSFAFRLGMLDHGFKRTSTGPCQLGAQCWS